MTTPCPHCSTQIEIDPTTLAALAGRSHFACPACQLSVRIPNQLRKLASTRRGTSRNLLTLGIVALLVLGGLGFHLASQKSGDIYNTTQNIRNEILNNTYFTELIASGATSRQDLEAIENIRPYRDGFIGISANSMDWEQANIIAERTGSSVLETNSDADFESWLISQLSFSSSSLAWIKSQGSVGLLTISGSAALRDSHGEHKVLLHWKKSSELESVIVNPPIDDPDPEKASETQEALDIPTEGLIAYYPFNGNARDLSGNGFHAEVHGAELTEDKAGNAQSAYQFDGKSSIIMAPVNINSDVAPNLTMVAWVRADSDQPKQSLLTHDTSGYCRSLMIDHRGGGVGWSAFCGTGEVLGYEPVETGKWTFLAVIYEEEKKMVTMYVNGRRLRKQGGTPRSHKTLAIGSRHEIVNCFRGAIDEVRIYSRALNESEIERLYQEFAAHENPEWLNQPSPYHGRQLTELVDLEKAAILVNDEFDDPARSGFYWGAMRNTFQDGRIILEGTGRPCWGTSAHRFENFAVQVIGRAYRERHHGWGICIYKNPTGRDAQGVEILLDSEGMISVVECRWTPVVQKGIDPVGPLPVTSFRKNGFNTLVATFSEGRKLAVFVNGAEACAPIDLPYVLEPAMLQLASRGGQNVASRLEFESFKVFSFREKTE